MFFPRSAEPSLFNPATPRCSVHNVSIAISDDLSLTPVNPPSRARSHPQLRLRLLRQGSSRQREYTVTATVRPYARDRVDECECARIAEGHVSFAVDGVLRADRGDVYGGEVSRERVLLDYTGWEYTYVVKSNILYTSCYVGVHYWSCSSTTRFFDATQPRLTRRDSRVRRAAG